MVVLIGPSGAGKSTLFDELGLKPTQRVNVDILRGMVCDDSGDQSATPAAVGLQRHLLGHRFERGLLTVIDGLNFEERVLDQYLEASARWRMFNVALVVDTPKQVCIDQDNMRSGSAHLGRETIEKIYAGFAKAIPSYGAVPGFAQTVRVSPTSIEVFGATPPKFAQAPWLRLARPAR